MDRDAEQQTGAEQREPDEAKKTWRKPEIVDVGDVLDLTEAVGGNLNDGSSAENTVSYWK